MKYVYVAGPYTQGDPVVNVRNAVLYGNMLLAAGLVPFVPHLSHLWHLIDPKPYTDWLAYDNEWLKQCDAVLRLPGPSNGADYEVVLAESLGIPVFTDIGVLVRAAHGMPEPVPGDGEA